MSEFELSRTAAKHILDDVQLALVKDCEKRFQELWPHDFLRAPMALVTLFVAVDTLLDYTSRSPRGRALMRKRLLQMVAVDDEDAALRSSDLQQLLPGLVTSMLAEDQAALQSMLTVQDVAGIANEVENWLAAGD